MKEEPKKEIKKELEKKIKDEIGMEAISKKNKAISSLIMDIHGLGLESGMKIADKYNNLYKQMWEELKSIKKPNDINDIMEALENKYNIGGE